MDSRAGGTSIHKAFASIVFKTFTYDRRRFALARINTTFAAGADRAPAMARDFDTG
jgi:hypothetical protein